MFLDNGNAMKVYTSEMERAPDFECVDDISWRLVLVLYKQLFHPTIIWGGIEILKIIKDVPFLQIRSPMLILALFLGPHPACHLLYIRRTWYIVSWLMETMHW